MERAMSSRKSKREKRKEKQKKRDRELGLPFPHLRKGGVTIIPGEDVGMEKMSDVLMEFVAPYEDMADTDEKLRMLLNVAIVAWNCTIVPAEQGKKLIEETLQAVSPDGREDYLGMVADLMERKARYFADNTRLILGFEMTMKPSGPHLNVISTLGKDFDE
jgi:hypothetical protein